MSSASSAYSRPEGSSEPPREERPPGKDHATLLNLPGFDIINAAEKPKDIDCKRFTIMDGLMKVQNQLESGFADQTGTVTVADDAQDLSEPDDVTDLPQFNHQHNRVGRLRGPTNVVKIDTLSSSTTSFDDPMADITGMDASQKHMLWPISSGGKAKRSKYRRYNQKNSLVPAPTARGIGVTAMHSEMMLRNPMLVRPSQTTTKTTPATTTAPADVAGQNARQKMLVHLDQRSEALAIPGNSVTDLIPRSATVPNLQQHAEVLIENQRGWFFLGFPFFSANMLFPSDPGAWTCGATGLATAPGDISSYPLPTPAWEWSWRRWYVDMAYDVDDQGWSYSWTFSSRTWHGSHVWFHSFVRRRRWIRLRQKIDTNASVAAATAAAAAAGTSNSNQDEDYQNYARSSFEAARYGPKYFAIPPAGRIETSIASEAPASLRRESMASVLSASNTQPTPHYLHLLQQKRAGNTPAASMRRLSHFSDQTSVASFLAEHRDFSMLLTDLQAARLDRERLDLLTQFVTNAGVYIDETSTTRADMALAELRTIVKDPNCIRALLQTFTFLDSKRHLISHLKKVLDKFSVKREPSDDSDSQTEDRSVKHEAGSDHGCSEKDVEYSVPQIVADDGGEGNDNDGDDSSGRDTEATALEVNMTGHAAFVRVVQDMIAICTETVMQQQYYTDPKNIE